MSTLTTETTNTESKKPKVSKKTKKTEKTSEIINDDASFKEESTKKETLTETTSKINAEEIQVKTEIDENNDHDENNDQEVIDSEETSSMEELLEYYSNLVKCLEFISKQNLKNYDVTKDSINQVTKLMNKSIKLFGSVQISTIEFTTKEAGESLKAKETKAKKPKKTVDKENYAINKVSESYSEVLSFMKLQENTLISKANILQEINAFVKKQKTANNPDIFFEGDNRRFKLIGDLKVLFEFIKKQMIKRGDLGNSDEFPKDLAYTQIMKYLKYCFPETESDKSKNKNKK